MVEQSGRKEKEEHKKEDKHFKKNKTSRQKEWNPSQANISRTGIKNNIGKNCLNNGIHDKEEDQTQEKSRQSS